jgi:hypothetical protein
VEDASCLAEKEGLITNLANGLSSDSESRALFTLLQYSSDSIQTIPMATGSLEGSVKEFTTALNKLISSKSNSEQPEDAELDGPQSKSTLSVIDEAINLETDSGYRDQILLFSCSSCSYGAGSSLGLSISNLKKHGIAFHYFADANFSSLSVKDVVGMDSSNIYRLLPTGGSVKQTRDKEMQPPKDACGPLALAADGSAWAADKPTVLLKALTDINRRVKWFQKDVPLNQNCICRSDKFGNGETECTKAKY